MKTNSDLQKFYPLPNELEWPTWKAAGVTDSLSGICLEAKPGGPLSLASPDGSLGGLTMPQGMAFDPDGTLYLLDRVRQRILRYEPQASPEQGRFAEMTAFGGTGLDVRQFIDAANMVISGHDLYIVDPGAGRVQVFAIHPAWPLRWVWENWQADVRPPQGQTDTWDPVDLAACKGWVYILDRRYGRVFRHHRRMTTLELVLYKPQAAGHWKRILVDGSGRLYLLHEDGPHLEIFDGQGKPVGVVKDTDKVRDVFDPPAICLLKLPSGGEFFCLPASLAKRCDRKAPALSPTPVQPLSRCLQGQAAAGERIFNRQGQPVQFDPHEAVGPPSYLTRGVWRSRALDSKVYRCTWHRVEMDWGPGGLPPGAKVTVSTYTANQDGDPPPEDSSLWEPGYTFVGKSQLPCDAHADSEEEFGPSGDASDFAVHSREGQYLWLKIELNGDGYCTPLVLSVRAYFPRRSYLGYLPAVYAEEDESRVFLELFLSIFQSEWDNMERLLAEFHARFDPLAMPSGKFIDELAGWLALPLEQRWSFEQKRHLLEAVPRFYRQRGTLSGLRAYLQAYLYNLTDIEPEKQLGFPKVLEGFRQRQHYILYSPQRAPAGPTLQAHLWSPGVVGRLQLDAFAREGEARLVSNGNPQIDLFNFYAHRFRVYIPACWVRTKDHEEMLRRALEAEKPAHTQYELYLVEARFRVGIQSTVGQDTLIGAVPGLRLRGQDLQCPVNAQPNTCLGYDTVLTRCSPSLLRLGRSFRMDLDTFLL